MEMTVKAKSFLMRWRKGQALGIIAFLVLNFFPNIYLIGEEHISPISTELAGINLGSQTEELLKLYPEIYKHELILGEYLYEACNQKTQEVFTFEEGPWSRSYITSISMRVEEDVTVCRDETGALPDYAILPITPQGVKLGDSREKILEVYGNPWNEHQIDSGELLITYVSSQKDLFPFGNEFTLDFVLKKDRIISVSLSTVNDNSPRQLKNREK